MQNQLIFDRMIITIDILRMKKKSTTLFSPLVDGIQTIISRPFSFKMFADNLNISLRVRDTTLTEQMIQETLDQIQKWADRNGLSFS